MARLPIPGSDNGTWGTLLNEFLRQIHNDDGTLKSSSISATEIEDGTITTSKLAPSTQDTLEAALSEITQDKQWIITGPINVAAGDIDYIAPAYITIPAGFAAAITSVRARINSGTNVNLRIERNGSPLSGLSSISATTSDTVVTGLNLALADGDLIAPVVNSTAGGLQNMTIMISYKLTKA